MDQLNKYILLIDSYFGSAPWFPLTLLATGVFFTIYLGFPQIRNFKNGWRTGFTDGIEIIEFDIPYSNHDSLFKRS